MYSREEFVRMFATTSSDELLDRLANRQLTDEAVDAIHQVLSERGMSDEQLVRKVDEERRNRYRRSGVTNDCDCCGKSAAISAIRDEGQKFCSVDCLELARSLEAATQLTEQEIRDRALAIKTGPCPRCKGRRSAVELHKRYWIWSAILVTRWGQDSRILCGQCAARSSLWAVAECLVLGWWGFPHGVLRTPVQAFRNIREAMGGSVGPEPSLALLYATKLLMGKDLWQSTRMKTQGVITR
jgi:hypothetical protein